MGGGVGRGRGRTAGHATFTAAVVLCGALLQAADAPRLEPLPAITAVTTQPPDTLERLIDVALILSGVAEADLVEPRRLYLEAADAVEAAVGGIDDPNQRAQQVLEFLHEQLLTDYVERQTRMDALIQHGTYNCVSSAVAYMILNRAVGLRTAGVRTSNHAFCRVLLDDGDIDVETTTPLGFDPGTRREFTDTFSGRTGYSYVPANRDPHRQETDDIGLLALILHNRVAFAGDDGRHLEAVGPAVDLYALTPDAGAYDVLQLALSNMGAHYGRLQSFADGLRLVDAAVDRYGADDRLLRMQHDLHYNAIVVLAQRGQLEAAQAALDRAAEGERVDARSWRELTANLAQQRAADAANQRDFSTAASHLLAALERVPDDRALWANLEAYLHNGFVELVNDQRLEEARSYLERARERHPTSRLLADDAARLERVLAGGSSA